MKKYIILILFVFISHLGFAQYYPPNDPDFKKDYNLDSNLEYKNISIFVPGILKAKSVDVGNMQSAWSISTGKNIKVAVLGYGFDTKNPEIASNIIDTGYDAMTNSSYGNYQVDISGNPVVNGGLYDPLAQSIPTIIAGGRDNGIESCGVAPDAKIIPINAFKGFPYRLPVMDLVGRRQTNPSDSQLSNAFDYAVVSGADVINCSWAVSEMKPGSETDKSIKGALYGGRGGKGTVVVFPAGSFVNFFQIPYPQNSIRDLLVVGSTDANGFFLENKIITKLKDIYSLCPMSVLDLIPFDLKAFNAVPGVPAVSGGFSFARLGKFLKVKNLILGYLKIPMANYGEALDLVTASTSIKQTKVLDWVLGNNPTYRSCATVSGIAALVMSKYPNLTMEQINAILEHSCEPQRESISFEASPAGTPDKDPRRNGEYTKKMGYGNLKAYAALEYAKSYIPKIVNSAPVITEFVKADEMTANAIWNGDSQAVAYEYYVSRSSTPPDANTTTTGYVRDLKTMISFPIEEMPLSDTSLYLWVRTVYPASDVRFVPLHTDVSPWSAMVQIELPSPKAPTNLIAYDIEETTLNLSWKAPKESSVMEVSGYDIYQDQATAPIASTDKTTLVYNVTGLKVATHYTFYVKAKYTTGEVSQASNVLDVATVDKTPPTPPDLQSSNTKATSTTLDWDGDTDNVEVTNYNVYKDGQLVANSVPRTFSIDGLTPATTYNFTVRALDAAKNISDHSNLISVTTLEYTPPTKPSIKPSDPTNPDIVEPSFSWSESTNTVGGIEYNIYQSCPGYLEPSLIDTTTVTTYTISAETYLTNDITKCTFFVKALDSQGNLSESSNIVSLKFLAPPSNLVASQTTANSTNLAWIASTDSVFGYKIYQDTSLRQVMSGATSFTLTDLTPSTAYTFSVNAMDLNGNVSPSSNIVNITTLPENDECSRAKSLTVNANDSCGSVTSGSLLGATASTMVSGSCHTTHDTDVWFSFIATNANQVIKLVNVTGTTTAINHSLWTGVGNNLTLVVNSCNDTNSSYQRGLTVGTKYYLRVSALSGGIGNQDTTFNVCVGVSNCSVGKSTIWNGNSWSNGVPDSSKSVVFEGDYALSFGNLPGCSCTIKSGNITVANGSFLTIENEVVLTGGTLTLENNASLIQNNPNTINSGNIIVKRNTTPVVQGDFTYWSSPTTGNQTLSNFSPNTQSDKFFTYHNKWSNATPATDIFVKGIGYSIASPQDSNASVAAVNASGQFTGVPNNGNVDAVLTLGSGLSNRLVGNPYPSALDADQFILANRTGNGTLNQTISGTLYFWTHNHPQNASFTASDYATYTILGGVGTAPSGTVDSKGNTSIPTQYIASCQGFFVENTATGKLTFTNDMRAGFSNTNFYKLNSTKTVTTTLEKNRIWLNLTNETTNFSQALVGYVNTATDGYDSGFDGKRFGTEPYALYSLINNDANEYTVQARTFPFADTDIVPLGFAINTAGNATISIDRVDGLFLNNQNIYLEDKLLNVTQDLKLASYTFATQAGTFNDRFALRYVTSSLGLNNFDDLQNKVTVVSKNQQIKIKSQLEPIKQVAFYDILGRKVFDKNSIDSSEFSVKDLNLSQQALIVKITLTNEQVVIKKLVY